MTYDIGNPGPGFGKEQKYYSVKPLKVIPILPLYIYLGKIGSVVRENVQNGIG